MSTTMKSPPRKPPVQFGLGAVFAVTTIAAYLAAAWAANVFAVLLCSTALILLAFAGLYGLARPRSIAVKGLDSPENMTKNKLATIRSASRGALSAGALLLFAWNVGLLIVPSSLVTFDTFLGFCAAWVVLGFLALGASATCGRDGWLFALSALSFMGLLANIFFCCYCLST